jgi:hypothetical protein
MRFVVVSLLFFLLIACNSPEAEPTTGLQGIVLRGLVQPVCQVDEPCNDEPFAASFRLEPGGKTFASDSEGKFLIYLKPGRYTVIPNKDAPIISPEAQTKEVEVLAGELTNVTLSFDTGIR